MTDTSPGSRHLEQTQEATDVRRQIKRADLDRLQSLAQPLIDELTVTRGGDLVSDMVINAIKLLRDQTNRGDLKLISKSFRELRYALKIFAPYRDVHKVSVFGSARTPKDRPEYHQAVQFAHQMANHGWMVITGAGGGIMAAGQGGAGAEPSFGLAIRLPFEQQTNETIVNDPKLINFKYFFTRKLMFVRSSHAIALFPGGFGTMDEGFEVLTLVQTGKSAPVPIVMVDHDGGGYWQQWQSYVHDQLLANGLISRQDLSLYRITHSVEEAVHEVCHFYRNFHSVRYYRELILIRLNHAPTAAQLANLTSEFADIIVEGAMRIERALPAERDEPTIAHLPRLVFHFNRHDHGRLRMLINRLNDLAG